MSRRKARQAGRSNPATFPDCPRHFLTPAVFRQAHQADTTPTRAASSSPRGVLREIRNALVGAKGRPGRGSYVARRTRACRDRKPRQSGKVRRAWPKRKDHKPPKPPKLRELDDRLKHKLRQHLQRQDVEQC